MTDSFFKDDADEKPSGEIPALDELAPDEDAADRFDSDEGRMAAIMAYIPLLCFVPLLSMKENKEARFHARQGVLLFLIELVAVLFLVDAISDLVFKGILIAAVALSIAGIVFAVQGRNYRLPIIGDLADKAKL
jgi:uncharacterized membrane protein